MSAGNAIPYGILLLYAYGLIRYIRYQRWSPEPQRRWEMTYERDAGLWDYTVSRGFPDEFQYKSGMGLTYRAAVRRSRRAAFLADRKITVKYK